MDNDTEYPVVLTGAQWEMVTAVLDHDLFFDNEGLRAIANSIEDQLRAKLAES